MSTARTHPTVPIEPIQPASEGVIVPELSGVAGDSSSSKFGDSQPMDKPYMSVARFAVEGEREKMKVLALIRNLATYSEHSDCEAVCREANEYMGLGWCETAHNISMLWALVLLSGWLRLVCSE